MQHNIIICGSKKNENLNVDLIVDSFNTIIRANMLLPNNKYGKRLPTLQIVNCHVYDNFLSSENRDLSCYTKTKKISNEHVKNFISLIKEIGKNNVKTFTNNNTNKFKKIINENNINIKIKKQLKCGLAYIPECIEKKQKPFLIGFSLKIQDVQKNVYTNCSPSGCHDAQVEINLIKELHRKGLIDASFCSLIDSESWEFDRSVIEPTKMAEEILVKIERGQQVK